MYDHGDGPCGRRCGRRAWHLPTLQPRSHPHPTPTNILTPTSLSNQHYLKQNAHAPCTPTRHIDKANHALYRLICRRDSTSVIRKHECLIWMVTRDWDARVLMVNVSWSLYLQQFAVTFYNGDESRLGRSDVIESWSCGRVRLLISVSYSYTVCWLALSFHG